MKDLTIILLWFSYKYPAQELLVNLWSLSIIGGQATRIIDFIILYAASYTAKLFKVHTIHNILIV